MEKEARRLTDFLRPKLDGQDLVVGTVSEYSSQGGTLCVDELYSCSYTFSLEEWRTKRCRSFIGGGTTFGDVGTFDNETGFFFLSTINGRLYQRHYQGHLPILTYEDGLWCLIYGFAYQSSVADDEGRAIFRPAPLRDGSSEQCDTLVRFELVDEILRFIARTKGGFDSPLRIVG
jgi:hypothetical protein